MQSFTIKASPHVLNPVKPLCIYHKSCSDGQGAAAVFVKRFPDAELFPGVYQELPPDVTDRHVYLVDFSYSRKVIEKMLESCTSLTIIDHHKTAIEALHDLDHPKLKAVFSTDHCGAVLTHQYLNPSLQLPDLLRYIEDRDLWQFKLPWTNAITSYLSAQKFDIANWVQMLDKAWFDKNVGLMVAIGENLNNQNKERVESLANTQRQMFIDGEYVPVANANPYFVSELGNILCKGYPFAAVYNDVGDQRVFSLRSDKDDKKAADVSKIAAKFGGGGHKNAAGFKVSIADLPELGLL